MLEERRGSFEGAIRIPLHASSFFFNDLAFLVIPRKSLKFLTPLFSIPTAPTNPHDFQRLIEAFEALGELSETVRYSNHPEISV